MNAPDAVPVALDTWPRREAYTFFSGLSDPFLQRDRHRGRHGTAYLHETARPVLLLRSGLAVHAVDQSHDRIPICHPKRPAGPARTP